MRRINSPLVAGILAAVLLVSSAEVAYAHVKWFERAADYPLRWDLFFRPLPLVFVAAVVLATLAAGLLWRRRERGFVPGPESFGARDEGRSTLYGLIPALLGVHVAVPLLFNGVQATFSRRTTPCRSHGRTSSGSSRRAWRSRSSTAGSLA
jgi:hypothetical protein